MAVAVRGCSLIMVVTTSLPAGFPMQMFVLRILTEAAQSPDPVCKVALTKKGSVDVRLVVGALC